MEIPSISGGGCVPASSAIVGSTSGKYHSRSLTRCGAIFPGQRTIMGMRNPPSYRVPLVPRNSAPVFGSALALWKPRGCCGSRK